MPPHRLDPPVALVPDIRIEYATDVAPEAVSMALNPITLELWYICFNGDVYSIKGIDKSSPISTKRFSSKDHGITRLQGIAFNGSTLFLCGNEITSDNKGNIGRMVRYNATLSEDVFTVVFTTEIYGTNKTTFDHGWNSIVISPDKKFIFVNSGSRTDHGEIQDNDGVWPNARDVALTAKIFRVPITTVGLLLRNNEKWLRQHGYIFADGIRNAFGLAFNHQDHLFAVVNSGDYDHPDEMFWIRQGRHYGFPWIMGGVQNPQQFPNWDAEKDPFLNEDSFAFSQGYFNPDPAFPIAPKNVKFTQGINNQGPDANNYRDSITGSIRDTDSTDYRMTTFTPHSSPVGLTFDALGLLPDGFRWKGFALRYSDESGSLMNPFMDTGNDLLLLDLTKDTSTNNFSMRTKRIVRNLVQPSDCLIIDDSIFILEYSEVGRGSLWKVDFTTIK